MLNKQPVKDADPLFVDVSAGDFRLQKDSPCIDAGDFLTYTTEAGQKTPVIHVADARFFTTGYGIQPPDQVQIEGCPPASIVGIDYENNIIELDTACSWEKGAGVSLPWLGAKPDIGAFEAN